MEKIFFQWWRGPAGQTFTTLHLSQNHATRFRRETSKRKRKGTWISTLHSKIGKRDVASEVHRHIVARLRGRNGIRGSFSEYMNNNFV